MSKDLYEKLKFLDDGNSVLQRFNHLSKEEHYRNILRFYNNSFNYINILPSFHVGFDYATDLLLAFVASHGIDLNQINSLIEVGCGHGSSTIRLLNDYSFNITSTDINPAHIEEVQRKSNNTDGFQNRLTTYCCNALSRNIFNMGRFDVVFSEDVFSHIPDRLHLLRNCHKLLLSGGILVFSDLTRKKTLRKSEYENQCTNWNLWNLESTSSYLRMLRMAGFSKVVFISDLGVELVTNHIRIESELGLTSHEKYWTFLNEDIQVPIQLKQSFLARLDSYTFLQERKLDYSFFIAWK